MVTKENYIKEKAIEFYNKVKQHYPVKKILLFGSYAKGNFNEDSDIDIAVIIDEKEIEKNKRIEITSELYKIASGIDVYIEPKCIFLNEYLNHEPASILAEIIRTGKVISE